MKDCLCDARFSGYDEQEYQARGCPNCICQEWTDFQRFDHALENLWDAVLKEMIEPFCVPILDFLTKVLSKLQRKKNVPRDHS